MNDSVRTLVLSEDASPFTLRELTPGATFRLELHSIFQGRDSDTAAVQNLTTRPNTPGRFIVWFRNETTLLVLWQPPYPAGIYSNYKVRTRQPASSRYHETLPSSIFISRGASGCLPVLDFREKPSKTR